MVSPAISFLLLLLGQVGVFARSFSHPQHVYFQHHRNNQQNSIIQHQKQQTLQENNNNNHSYLLALRGGEQQEEVAESADASKTKETSKSVPIQKNMAITTAFLSLGKLYVKALDQRPILTKSVTASFVFGLSDYLAQKIESRGKSDDDEKQTSSFGYKRMISAMLVGLIYFGPASHYWYDWVFKLLPGTNLVSILQKAALGQALFGPSFTCIFFATTLMQAGEFSIPNWFRKIKSDLFMAWLAGVGYWPLVDLISFGLIPIQFIPLFVNICALIWNVYLSLVANAKSSKISTA